MRRISRGLLRSPLFTVTALLRLGIGPVVLLFTFGVSMLAGVLFGLLPILPLARPRLAALKDGGRSASEGRERHRTRSVLVIAEVALAVVLLVGSGLMIRTRRCS